MSADSLSSSSLRLPATGLAKAPPHLHLTTSKVMVIVWRLRGNIIRTVLHIANVLPLQWAQLTKTVHIARLRLRNDLYCVEWGVKLYSLTHWLKQILCSGYVSTPLWAVSRDPAQRSIDYQQPLLLLRIFYQCAKRAVARLRYLAGVATTTFRYACCDSDQKAG